MAGKYLKGFVFVLLIFSLAGCTRAKTRMYAEDRPRVDQEMDGNFGYLSGTPRPEDRSQYKRTRRYYVLEFTDDSEQSQIEEDLQWEEVEGDYEETSYETTTETTYTYEDEETIDRTPSEAEQNFTFGVGDVDMSDAPKSVKFVEYTVQKEDTLQNISKKFYNSYSQWKKIYDYNKELIADPNRITPGLVLKIPQE